MRVSYVPLSVHPRLPAQSCTVAATALPSCSSTIRSMDLPKTSMRHRSAQAAVPMMKLQNGSGDVMLWLQQIGHLGGYSYNKSDAWVVALMHCRTSECFENEISILVFDWDQTMFAIVFVQCSIFVRTIEICQLELMTSTPYMRCHIAVDSNGVDNIAT